MTEAEWLACSDPAPMLEFLRGKVSDRKFRLFAVACCRHIWNLLTDERSRQAVDIAERVAEGVGEESLARQTAVDAGNFMGADPVDWRIAAAVAAYETTNPLAFNAALRGSYYAWNAQRLQAMHDQIDKVAGIAAAIQKCLLQDITGNPFLLKPAIKPEWHIWSDASIPKLAQAIYDNRFFSELPMLADALMDAGCHDVAILSHCRQLGTHVRGCWVLDLLLGKE